jgi:hypothetical protein
MPNEIDVSDVLYDPGFVGCPAQDPDDGITVRRRMEVVDDHGRASWQVVNFQGIVASVISVADQPVVRGPEQMHLPQLIEVHSLFRIQGPSPGYAPDRVVWNGTEFQVNKVTNNSKYGAGFVMADCSSVDFMDQPPGGPDPGGVEAPVEPDLSGGS